MRNLFLPLFWVGALLVVVILSDSFSDKSLHFFGIAGESEQTIKFQYPVEIVKIFVAEGKNVEQGELMLEVKRHELDHDLSVLEQEIRGFELQKQETHAAIDNQQAGLQSKKQAIIADMDYQIHALELKLKMHADMMNSLSVAKQESISVTESTELNYLKKKRHFLIQGVQTEIAHLTEQLNGADRPIDAQIEELLHRKEELQRQNVSLKVSAKFNGRVGSVHFKAGELVSAFQPIITAHSRVPRYIKGYIHENILNDVKVNQTVWVQSTAINHGDKPLIGVVESMGNRIVEYPERLKKNPMVPAWGREILIRLNTLEHSLLFGEKVQMFLENPDHSTQWFSMMSDASASRKKLLKKQDMSKINSTNAAIKAKKIEASGLVWNSQEGHYLLVSDEQYQHKASIFIMEDEGTISAGLNMPDQVGKEFPDDLESISIDGGFVYVLSSLSHNKHDHIKAKRKKLMRFKYHKNQVTEQQDVDLYAALKQLSEQSTDSNLVRFLKQAIGDHSLDIESHIVLNNDLYLGFKSPFIDAKKVLIMKIPDVNALFAGAIPSAEIWRSIALRDPETGGPMKLSDMVQVDGQWFFLGVSRSPIKQSVLWHYQAETGLLSATQSFLDLKAEGIAYNPKKLLFTVVFDRGKNKRSRYLSIPFSEALGKS